VGKFQSLLAPKVKVESKDSERLHEETAPTMIAMKDVFVKAPKSDGALKGLEKKSARAEFRAPPMFRKS